MGHLISDKLGDSVTVHMRAPVEAVWDLVSDVTRIGEFSPETFEARWTRGSTGPEVGAFFKGHVKRNGIGPTYWTLCRVDACEPGRRFEFTVTGPNGMDINTWGYELAPTDDGVDVTEYFRLAGHPATRIYWTLMGWARGRTNRKGMRTTLERIRDVVEAEQRA